MLNYDKEEHGDIVLFALQGSLDAGTAPQLKKDLESLLAGDKTQVIFDFFGLELIDSSGVGAIVSVLKRLRTQKGDVKIARLRGQPAEIFRLLRLNQAFDISDSNEQALARFLS